MVRVLPRSISSRAPRNFSPLQYIASGSPIDSITLTLIMHCTPRSLITNLFSLTIRRSSLPPSFLLPSIYSLQSASFSTSSPSQVRKDRNPNRGISALRHTGLRKRQKLSVKLENLPKPVLDPRRRSVVEVSEDHGLWDFFNRDRTTLSTPGELSAHGRAWTVSELRSKDWDDLWRLWWMCVKERNRVMTFLQEKQRIGKMIGSAEAGGRLKVVS